MTAYLIGQGHRLSTNTGGERYTLDAGARVPAALIAAWIAAGDLEKFILGGIIVEAAPEPSPSSENPPATSTPKRRTAAQRSALGLALRKARA